MNYLTYTEKMNYLLEMIKNGRLYSLNQASEKYNCSKSTIKRMLKTLRPQGYSIKSAMKSFLQKKARFTLFLAMLISSSNTQGQSFMPIINIDSTLWDIAHMELFGTVMCDLVTQNETDSIYSKMYIYESSGNHSYFGKIREDTISGKIWFVKPNNQNEILIMDMGLALSDTFLFSNTPGIVDSIYYRNYRKIIRFDLGTRWDEAVEFIEGVGPNISLVYALDPDYDRFYVTCKYNIDSLVYINNNINFIGCMPDPTLIENKTEKKGFILFPNPTSDVISINFSQKDNQSSKFILCDALGQKIIEKVFIGNNITINLENIKKGVYFAAIINKQNTHYQTIIISN